MINFCNIIHMTTSMSLRLNLYYAIHNVQDSFMIMLFVLVYVRVVILLTFGKHVHHNIMSLSGEAWALVPFIEVPVPSQESQRSVAVPSQESQWLYKARKVSGQ